MPTAAAGMPINTPATAIFVMLLRTPDDRVQVIANFPSPGAEYHKRSSDSGSLMFPPNGSMRQLFIKA